MCEPKTKLYRAVNNKEFNQLMTTQRFEEGPNSLEGKFFAESIIDAIKWGNCLEGQTNLGASTLKRRIILFIQ